ncbi:MAG: hypothetical protein QW228_06870 [Candidatus Aenigmatarchaeota archaeon]
MKNYSGDSVYEGVSISKRKKALPFKKLSKVSDFMFECSYDCDYCFGCDLKLVLKNNDLKSYRTSM